MAKKRALIRRPTSRPPNQPGDFTVEVLGRRYPVIDMADASMKVSRMIGMSGMGASEIGAEFPIRDGELVMGYVSYNGRVWRGMPGSFPKSELMYDPSGPSEGSPAFTPSRVVRNNPRSGCYIHDFDEECRQASRGSCRYGGCDGRLCQEEPVAKTVPQYYADTKSLFCDDCRGLFLKEHRFDDRRGDWVPRSNPEDRPLFRDAMGMTYAERAQSMAAKATQWPARSSQRRHLEQQARIAREDAREERRLRQQEGLR